MLNPFPNLLMFGFFAPTLLRVAAAFVVFYVAYSLMTNRERLSEMTFPIIGHYRPWMATVSSVACGIIGFSLLLGYLTQWGALLGGVMALKQAVMPKRYAAYMPLSRGTSLLLLVICLSLLISGAGAMAQDLPL